MKTKLVNEYAWATWEIITDWYMHNFVPKARAHCCKAGLPADCKIVPPVNCSAYSPVDHLDTLYWWTLTNNYFYILQCLIEIKISNMS